MGPALNDLPVIDWDLAIKLAGNKKELAHDMLGMLIKLIPQDLTTIKELYATKHYLELRNKVHKLHGAICYCGTPRLKIVLTQLETDLKNNIMTNLPSLLNQLDTEVDRLLKQYPRTVMA